MVKDTALWIFILIASVFFSAAYGRNVLWKDGITLWKDVAAKSPLSQSSHNNLGVFYFKDGFMKEATVEFVEAIRIRPDYGPAHKNLGVAYERLGRLDEAIKEFGVALSFEPDYEEKRHYAEIHYNRGNAYAKKGLYDKAIEDYEFTLKVISGHVQARNNLALSNLELGRLDAAEDELKKAIAFYPDYVDAHYNIGLVYVKKGMPEEALAHFEKALALDPGRDKAARAIREIKGFFTRERERAKS
ncbi:MAG: tetratricopeptide repeat protein [Thermodesulfobacteriota bacterium]